MADPFVDIRGVITTSQIITDPERKKQPYIKVELLQVTKIGSNITSVKDNDLTRRYSPGQNVCLKCKSSTWLMNGKAGTSYTVFDGTFEDVNLSFCSDLNLKDKKVGSV